MSFSKSPPPGVCGPGRFQRTYLVFELLDLGLSDCVFDLELLGAEEEERDERVVRPSNAWLHKLSRYCGDTETGPERL